MKKIKHVLSVLTIFAASAAFAQSSLPFDEQYFTSEKFLINPAFAGITDDIAFKVSHRRQWDNLPNSPETTIASIHGVVVDRLAVGAYFMKDRNGNTSTNTFNLAAAYHIPIGEFENRQDGQFSFGSSLSFAGIRFDGQPENLNDPLYMDQSTVYVPYLNLGASVQYKGWTLAASVLDIPLSYNSPMVNELEPSPIFYYGMLGKRFNVSSNFELEPMVAYRMNEESESRLDANLRAKFKVNENAVWVGANYRTDFWGDNNQATAISPAVGAEIGRFNVGAAYNIGLSDISNEGNNGFSISIGYNIENFFSPNHQ